MRGWRRAGSGTVAFFLGLASVTSCGTDPVRSTTSEQGEPEDEFLGHLVQAACRGLEQCCDRFALSYSKSHCEYAVRLAIIDNGDLSSRQTMTYRENAAARCISEVEALMASCVMWQDYRPLSCQAVYSGPVEPGGACSHEDDCRDPAGGVATCLATFGQPSRCTELHSSPEGGVCATTCSLAGGVLFCDPAVNPAEVDTSYCLGEDNLFCSTAGRCMKLGGRGAACRTSSECQGGLWCNTEKQLCAPRLLAGSACPSSDACVHGTRCRDGLCQAANADGAHCTTDQSCAGLCDATQTCQAGAVDGLVPPFIPTPLLCSPELPANALGEE